MPGDREFPAGSSPLELPPGLASNPEFAAEVAMNPVFAAELADVPSLLVELANDPALAAEIVDIAAQTRRRRAEEADGAGEPGTARAARPPAPPAFSTAARRWDREVVLFGDGRPSLDASRPLAVDGHVLVVPLLHWLREAERLWPLGAVRQFFDQLVGRAEGSFDRLGGDERASAIAFTRAQLVYNVSIEPVIKQGLLLYDDVFLVTEYDTGDEDILRMRKRQDPRAQPRVTRGNAIPDVISLPITLDLGFMANFAAHIDNKDRRLRMPGWRGEQNFAHLKNVNHSLNELFALYERNQGSGSFTLLVPGHFTRVMERKALLGASFQQSPSASILFPDLQALPWDEVRDLARSKQLRELRRGMAGWDTALAEAPGEVDWTRLGSTLQPLVDAVVDELDIMPLNRAKSIVGLLAGLLPSPANLVPGIVDLYQGFCSRSVGSAIARVQRRVGRARR